MMNKNLSDFGRFPTDNSSTTNLKYDIIASKFMTGIENHHRNKTNGFSIAQGFGLIGIILEGAIAILILLVAGLSWLLRKSFR